MKAVIWHNPRCSKSRQALAILEETPGLDVEIFEYLTTPPTRSAIAAVLVQLAATPSQALRKTEDLVKDIALDVSNEEAVLDAMAQHAILIERPIVITDRGAVIARPPEKLHDIL